MKRLTTGIFCALALQSALILPAHAHRRHHHHRHHHHHVVKVQDQAPVATPEPSNFGVPSFPLFWRSSDSVVKKARSYLGAGAIFGRHSLWCARFMNVVLLETGHHGTHSDLAMSFAKMPETSMHVGAIAVMRRRGGGHVGVVSGIDADGNPIIISGNSGNRVRERVYRKRRILKFVAPV